MNKANHRNTLIDLLCGHRAASTISPGEWTAVIATARAANLLGGLAEKLAHSGTNTGCNADRHLEGARQLSERQRRSVRWEAQCIQNALSSLHTPVVLLKGAAYAMGGHANALGRLFGDIDILVPPETVGAVEVRLMTSGWTSVASNTPYDQRYYREWMHELPPMVHVKRGTVLDVHHTILPPTARLKPNARRIIERAAPLAEFPSLSIPCPEDLIIHSITHLVHEGELHNGLRDLYDIHLLITGGSAIAGFWDRLAEYTLEHGLSAPVGLGIRLVQRYFRTDIPDAVRHELTQGDNNAWHRTPVDFLYDLSLRPCPGQHNSMGTHAADLALYVRAHWLRMPPLLLARHLSRKMLFRIREGLKRPTAEREQAAQ